MSKLVRQFAGGKHPDRNLKKRCRTCGGPVFDNHSINGKPMHKTCMGLELDRLSRKEEERRSHAEMVRKEVEHEAWIEEQQRKAKRLARKERHNGLRAKIAVIREEREGARDFMSELRRIGDENEATTDPRAGASH